MRCTFMLGSFLFIPLACGPGDPDPGTDTGEIVPSVSLNEALRSDLLSTDFGLLAATDLSVDFVVLREAGTAFEFIEGSFASWGRSEVEGQNGHLTNCIDLESSLSDIRQFDLKNCFVGVNRNRQLNGSGTTTIDGTSLVVDVDWSFSMGSTVELSGTYTASWDNLIESSLADGLLDMDIDYLGNTYFGRHFSVRGASVDVSDRPEIAPNFYFPAEGNPGTGVTITWDDRNDLIEWGMALENQENQRFNGSLWGSYTTESGSAVTLENGTVSEDDNNHVETYLEASFATDNTSVSIAPISVTWASQSDSFSGTVGFYAERTSEIQFDTWSSPLSLVAYTINPLEVSGDDGDLQINGAIEFGFQTIDANEAPKEEWLFGTCEGLEAQRTDAIPQTGQCDFANASGAILRLFFQNQSDGDEHLLVDNGSEEWICRNVDSSVETGAGPVSEDPDSCP